MHDRLTLFAPALVILAATALVAPHAAKATALAYSSLDIDNFGFGITTGTDTTVAVSNITNVSNISTVLNGTPASNGGSSTVLPLDVTQVCVPAACGGIGQNDFTRHPGLGDLSRADSLIGLPTNPTSPTGAPATARSQQVAETNLFNPGSGSANTRNGLVASFSFVLTGPGPGGGSFDLAFDANQLLSVLLSQPLGTVQASTAFRLTIRDPDGNVALDWVSNGALNAGDVTGYIGGTEVADPFNLNTNISRTNNTSPINLNNSGVFEIDSNLFPTGILFDVSLNSNADTFATNEVAVVTEPALPAAFGGLFILVHLYLRRRRHS